MFATYLTVTLIAAVMCGPVAVLNLIDHDYPRRQADKLGVSRSWMPLLGTLLGAGTLGLLAGMAVPLLGTLAALGLVLYFTAAFYVHVRVNDNAFALGIMYFLVVAAALAVRLAHHGAGGAWAL